MKKSILYFFVALVSFSVLAFSSQAQTQTNMNLDQFVAKIKATPNAQLLDVRTPQEWAQGKIASSKCINYNDPTFASQVQKLDKNKPIFVYCAVGGRSSRAAQILTSAGFKQVYNLQGAGYSGLAAKGIK